MDNLSSHKRPRVEQLIEAGRRVALSATLQPYTNPIEKAISKLEALLRKIAERSVSGLMNALENCAKNLQTQQIRELF